jgi:hypothetical protein
LSHTITDKYTSRQQRMQDSIQKKAFSGCQHGTVIRVQDVVHSHHMSNIEYVVQEIHDILKSYYKVARKRFTDNLCMQAADYHLVTGPVSPLKLFSPSFVSGLTDEQLVEIAGEDILLKRKRAALTKEIAGLEEGKRVLA